MKGCRKGKGFTLIELLFAMGISFMVLLIIYFAFFVSETFFGRGTDIIQEQNYTRNLFSKISEDLRFLSRLNRLSAARDELEFEIFNKAVIKTDPATNDKLLKGNVITYQTAQTKDFEGKVFLVLQRKTENYEWLMRFGHSQKPNYEEYPPGYPDDMRDPIYGKQMASQGGNFQEVLEQEYGKEFLIKKIEFIPYDDLGKVIGRGEDFDSLKTARCMKVNVEYRLQSRYGEGAGYGRNSEATKTASTMVSFINFVIYKESESASLPGNIYSGFFAKNFLFAIR